MSNGWRDQLAGARMQVDQQFNDRVLSSEFSNQEWGLIMTAVEFDIEDPEDPETAELVANTDHIDQIMPELDNLPQGLGASPDSQSDSSGGFLSSVKNALGLSPSTVDEPDSDDFEAATALVEEYTAALQAHLEDEKQWAAVCSAAVESEAA
jgi:hypothetical protein